MSRRIPWPGHRMAGGNLGSGKSTAMERRFGELPAPGIFWDPAHDAKIPGATLADYRTPVRSLARGLLAGDKVLYRSAGQRFAAREVAFLSDLCAQVGDRAGESFLGCVLAVDEAQTVAGEGRVVPELMDLIKRGRHRGTVVLLGSPIPQQISYEIRALCEYLWFYRLPWMPWLARHGLTEAHMEELWRAPPGTGWAVRGGRVDRKILPTQSPP